MAIRSAGKFMSRVQKEWTLLRGSLPPDIYVVRNLLALLALLAVLLEDKEVRVPHRYYYGSVASSLFVLALLDLLLEDTRTNTGADGVDAALVVVVTKPVSLASTN